MIRFLITHCAVLLYAGFWISLAGHAWLAPPEREEPPEAKDCRRASRERRRPATASPDIAELHSRRLNIEQRIVDATRQVRELQELGRVIAT